MTNVAEVSVTNSKGIQEVVAEFLEMASPTIDPSDWTGYMVLRCTETDRWESVAVTAGHVIRSFSVSLGITNIPTDFVNKFEVELVSVGAGGSIRGDTHQMYRFVSTQEYIVDQGKSLGFVSSGDMVAITTPPYIPGSKEDQIYKQVCKHINNQAGFYEDTVIQGWPMDTTLVYKSTGLRVRCFRDSRGLVTMRLDDDVSTYTDLGELYTDSYIGPLVTGMCPRTLNELVDITRKILPGDPEGVVRLPLTMDNHPVSVLEVGPTYSRVPYWLQSATDLITRRYNELVGSLAPVPEVEVARVMGVVRTFLSRQGMDVLYNESWQQVSVEGLTTGDVKITIDIWRFIHNNSPVYRLVLSTKGDGPKGFSLDRPYQVTKVTVLHDDGTTSIAHDSGDDVPVETAVPFLADIVTNYLLHKVGMSTQRVEDIMHGGAETIRVDFLVPSLENDAVLLPYSTMIFPVVDPISAIESSLTKEQLHRIYITKLDIIGPQGTRIFSIIS